MTWKSAARFYRQLGLVHRAGIPVSQAVAMAGEATADVHARLAPEWSRGCERGSPLATQLAAAGEAPLAVALVQAGETSGRMPEMAALLADHYEHLMSLRALAIGRLVYPVLLLHVALMIPALAGVVLGTKPAWMLLVGPACLWAVVLAVVGLEAGMRGSGLTGRLALRRPLDFLAMPMLVGNACRALRAAFTAGMLTPDALELAAGATGNRAMAERLRRAGADVRHGRLPDLASALAAAGFPADAVRHIANGERSGKVEETLDQWAVVSAESFRSRTMWTTRVITGTIYAIAMICAVLVIFSMAGAYVGQISQTLDEIDG